MNTQTEFVIRSMSTTDYRPADRWGPEQKPVPYHIYLKPIDKRASAFWTNHTIDAMKFANVADAQAEADRINLTNYEISAIGNPTNFWDNRDARRAGSTAA